MSTKKHSKRITLGTYTFNQEGKPTLFNSFAEGDYVRDGLRAAIADAERLSATDEHRHPYNGEREKGLCVAVFSIGFPREPRIVATFPWPVPPAACSETPGPFCTDPMFLHHEACSL